MLWRYRGTVDRTVEVSPELRDLWLDSAKSSRLALRAKALLAIPDEASYVQYLAEPASSAFAEFVNDLFPGAGIIEFKHKAKVRRRHKAWDANIRKATEEGGAFEQGLEKGKDKYFDAKFGLRCTGTPRDMPGPCWKAVYALSGSKKPLEYPSTLDYWENPDAICSPFELWARIPSRTLLLPPLLLGLVLAMYAQELFEKGLSGFAQVRDYVIERANGIIEDYLSKIKVRDCYLRIEYDTFNFFVEAGVI